MAAIVFLLMKLLKYIFKMKFRYKKFAIILLISTLVLFIKQLILLIFYLKISFYYFSLFKLTELALLTILIFFMLAKTENICDNKTGLISFFLGFLFQDTLLKITKIFVSIINLQVFLIICIIPQLFLYLIQLLLILKISFRKLKIANK